MAKEKITKIDKEKIKDDSTYLLYEMLMQSLKTDNVREGISTSLSLLRDYLESDNIAIFIKNKDNKYIYRSSDKSIPELIPLLGGIVNTSKNIPEKQGMFNLDYSNTNDKLKNIIMIYLKTKIEGISSTGMPKDKEAESIVTIINNNNKNLEPQFWNSLKDTLLIIFKRSVSYENNTKAARVDFLTGLSNRFAYESKIKELDAKNNKLTIGIFDLFRLKYINDNYNHNTGDIYIQKVAEILDKYWPSRKVIYSNGTETIEDTGTTIYRIGGDEFSLLTESEDVQLTKTKATLASLEASMIDLGIGENIPLGVNYGIVQKGSEESIKKAFARADDIMEEDKKAMYKKHNLERRR